MCVCDEQGENKKKLWMNYSGYTIMHISLYIATAQNENITLHNQLT